MSVEICIKLGMAELNTLHISRFWRDTGHPLENVCPCPQEACGYVSMARADPKCPQHGLGNEKTIRDSYMEKECPG